MRRKCRERFPHHRFQRKSLSSDHGMHHGMCVTHVPWCMSGSLTRRSRENVPGIPMVHVLTETRELSGYYNTLVDKNRLVYQNVPNVMANCFQCVRLATFSYLFLPCHKRWKKCQSWWRRLACYFLGCFQIFFRATIVKSTRLMIGQLVSRGTK